MPRLAVNVTKLNGRSSTMYPLGPPSPAPTGTLRYIGNPVHNGEVTIISDGTIDFGTKYGYLLQAVCLDSSIAGTDFQISESTIQTGQQVLSTSYTSSDRIKIHAVAGSPYGIGLAMGDQDLTRSSPKFGKIETLTRAPYDVVFKYEIGIYPAANQANCITNSISGHQIKGAWDFYSPDGTSASIDTDAYTGVFSPGPTFGEPALSASNNGFTGSVIYPVEGNYTPIRLDTTHYRTTLAIRESTLTFSKTDGSVHMRYADVVDGTLCSYHVDVDIEPTIINVSPDRSHFPANIQGVYIDQGSQYYINERVVLAGSAARVEIADTESPQTDRLSATKTRKFALTLPVAWSRYAIKRKIREQVFAGESLIGKYFHIYTHGTVSAPAGVFVGSILITGEVLE